ncbi:MAG: YkgJ family cysteine cluster protein [Planctomycetaceae bacterium]
MSEQQAPWYADGLAFECTQCGDCCTGSPGHVWVNDEEIAAIAQYLGKSVGEIRLLHTHPARGGVSLNDYANGDCVFLDAKARNCTVYPVRPRQCRTWPFWNSNLEDPKAWKETCRVCPGAGRGQLYTLSEIEERSKVIDI